MKAIAYMLIAVLSLATSISSASGQQFARSPSPNSPDALQALAKKIDEQNAKIDMLSQQILKLQQDIAALTGSGSSTTSRPGVIIGEGAPNSSATATAPAQHFATASATATGTGTNSHVVSRGETLTSIAKMYKVTVDELQKYNHIENPLKLQVGQTIMIPGPPTPTPAPPE